jgi:hypothetical protein
MLNHHRHQEHPSHLECQLPLEADQFDPRRRIGTEKEDLQSLILRTFLFRDLLLKGNPSNSNNINSTSLNLLIWFIRRLPSIRILLLLRGLLIIFPSTIINLKHSNNHNNNLQMTDLPLKFTRFIWNL